MKNISPRFYLRSILLLMLFLTPLGVFASAGAPEFWGFHFGQDWDGVAKELKNKALNYDVQLGGRELGRTDNEKVMMFQSKNVWGKSAQAVQLIFQNSKLTKVRISFQKGQNPQSYFDSVYEDLVRILKGAYFAPQKQLSHLRKGAAWLWPDGQAAYLGFITDSDLVLVITDKEEGMQNEPGLFPRSEK